MAKLPIIPKRKPCSFSYALIIWKFLLDDMAWKWIIVLAVGTKIVGDGI